MIGQIDAGAVEVLCCISCGRPIECTDRRTDGVDPLYACPKCGMEFLESEGAWKPLNSYHFGLGDSTKGSIGFCASVLATTKPEAVETLRKCLPAEHEMSDSAYAELVYLNVYFNEVAVSAKDIDEWAQVRAGELNSAQLKMLNITPTADVPQFSG